MISEILTEPKKSQPEAPKRESLSSSLRSILGDSKVMSVTLNDLMKQTGGRGLYLVMILLCLPFITPIPLPVLSNVVGPVISLLAIRLAFRLPPRLPRFIGAREISRQRIQAFITASARAIRILETIARPRYSGWLELRPVRFINALFLALMGLLLALPIPPVVPFTHSLPSWAIMIGSLAMMEGDGLLIILGYAVGLGTIIYFTLCTGLFVTAIQYMFNIG